MESNVREIHSFYTVELECHNCYDEFIENFILISKRRDYKKDDKSYISGIVRQSDSNFYEDENGEVRITVIIDIEKWKEFRKGIDKTTYIIYKYKYIVNFMYLNVNNYHQQ